MADTPDRGLRHKPVKEPSRPKGKNYLLAIGINSYEHCATLVNARTDAEAVVQKLTEKYQFEEEDITTLYDEEATYDNLDDTFRAIARTMNKADNLVIWFSGHGHYDEYLDEGYWVPVDAQYKKTRDYYSYNRLMRSMRRIPSKHILLIADSCYAGAVLVRETPSGFDRLEQDPSRWILASGRNEVVPDGRVGGSSPFAEQLLDVLDRYADEPITVMRLVDKVTTAVVHNARQTPIGCPLRDVGDKGGQFVFYPRFSAFPPKVQVLPPSSQETALEDLNAWQSALKANTQQAFKSYLSRFPQGLFAELAEQRLKKLESPPKAKVTPPKPEIIPPADPNLPEMVLVEGGTFWMGSPKDEVERSDDETLHQVSLDSYYIGKYPVTQRQWKAIMGIKNNPSHFIGDDLPVERVSWKDAVDFVEKLNKKTGLLFRLPTEAEWEFAAGGGFQGRDDAGNRKHIYAGRNTLEEVGWYYGNSGGKTHPIGQKAPNALGIYDMSGNVWEWCEDWYGSYPSGAVTNPKGPKSGSYRVIRGGCWYGDAQYCRVANRDNDDPSLRYSGYGFRLCRTR